MRKGLGKVALVGPGAVGGFYGGMLSNSGVDLKFIFRSSYDQVCQKGLWLVHHCDDGREERVDPLHSFRDPREIGECDWVIVAIKSTANDQLEEILPMVGPAQIFLPCKRMGSVETLADAFGSKDDSPDFAYLHQPHQTQPDRKPVARIVQFGQYGPLVRAGRRDDFCL